MPNAAAAGLVTVAAVALAAVLVVDRSHGPTFHPSRVVCGGLVCAGAAAACVAAVDGTPRQRLLSSVAVVFSLRFMLMLFVLVPRRVLWWESICTGGGCALLFPGFVVAAATASPSLCLTNDLPAFLLHVAGSVLTTGSEVQRWQFKRTLRRGAEGCYTGGLFSVARHINYTGEVLCFAGWAMLTNSNEALVVPLFFWLALTYFYAPGLDRHLTAKYGGDKAWREWQAPAFAPSWLLLAATLLCAAHVGAQQQLDTQSLYHGTSSNRPEASLHR